MDHVVYVEMPFIPHVNQPTTVKLKVQLLRTLVQHIMTTIKHPKPMLRNYDYVNLYLAKANCTQLQYALWAVTYKLW